MRYMGSVDWYANCEHKNIINGTVHTQTTIYIAFQPFSLFGYMGESDYSNKKKTYHFPSNYFMYLSQSWEYQVNVVKFKVMRKSMRTKLSSHCMGHSLGHPLPLARYSLLIL